MSSITQDDYFLSWDRETIKKQEGFEKGGEPNNHDFLSWIRPSPNDELPVQNGQIAKDDDVDVGSIRVKGEKEIILKFIYFIYIHHT